MYRRSGLIALGFGALIVSLLLFSSFNQELNRWTKNEDGNRVKAVALCESPWSLFVEGAEQEARFRTDAEACRKGARFKATLAVVVGRGCRRLVGIP